jgi:hypothetical protein
MGLIWGRRLEKKISELIIVVSLLFSVSLAQAGKTSDAEIAVRKSGIALEQGAIKKVKPVGLGMAYSAIGDKQAALKECRIIKKLDPRLAQQLLSNIKQ